MYVTHETYFILYTKKTGVILSGVEHYFESILENNPCIHGVYILGTYNLPPLEEFSVVKILVPFYSFSGGLSSA